MAERKLLSQEDKEWVFRRATAGFEQRYSNKISKGMSDAELEQVLKASLGIFGGSGGPDQLSVTRQGSGLKIWGSWEVHNHVTATPLFAGKSTVAMARLVYGIIDPTGPQLQLF